LVTCRRFSRNVLYEALIERPVKDVTLVEEKGSLRSRLVEEKGILRSRLSEADLTIRHSVLCQF